MLITGVEFFYKVVLDVFFVQNVPPLVLFETIMKNKSQQLTGSDHVLTYFVDFYKKISVKMFSIFMIEIISIFSTVGQRWWWVPPPEMSP